jgi:hypothetical protein
MCNLNKALQQITNELDLDYQQSPTSQDVHSDRMVYGLLEQRDFQTKSTKLEISLST